MIRVSLVVACPMTFILLCDVSQNREFAQNLLNILPGFRGKSYCAS